MYINPNNLGYYIVPELTKGGICVDIGANVGCFIEKYKSFFKTIHYYEPIKILYDSLQNKYNSYNNIIGYNEAVYNNDNEKVSIFLHTNNESGSCAIKSDIIDESFKEDWTNTIIEKDIYTVSLETIFKRLDNMSIDYMKIDCETSEYLLLINKDLSKIKYMGIEIHNQLGEQKWNKLINHILLYFDNPLNQNLSYSRGLNKEFYFKNKNIP